MRSRIALVSLSLFVSLALSGCVSRGGAGAPAPTPSAATASDGALRDVGVVPWRDAISQDPSSRTITIDGDGDLVHGAVRTCGGTDQQRAEVHETATRVEILVRGFAAASKVDQEVCDDVGHPPTRLTIRLRRFGPLDPDGR